MNAYVYRAALYCEECGERISRDTPQPAGMNPDDEYTWDSGDYPKGPYPDGGGEADSPQHCDACGVFLENPLTDDGRRYVAHHLADALFTVRSPEVRAIDDAWREFYSIEPNVLA